MRQRKNNTKTKLLIGVVLLGITAAITTFLDIRSIESEKPKIVLSNQKAWNINEPLKIGFSDNEALGAFAFKLSDGSQSIQAGSGVFPKGTKKQSLLFRLPKNSGLDLKGGTLLLDISIKDRSVWNFFRGNETNKRVTLMVDRQPPFIEVLSHSYTMTQGGSALVVYRVKEENLAQTFIETPYGMFTPTPYKTKGVFATLIAWPFDKSEFEANIVATDTAGNTRELNVPLNLVKKKYKESWVEAKDSFINGKISQLIHKHDLQLEGNGQKCKMVAVNEKMRIANEEKITQTALNFSRETLMKPWQVEKFYPLENGQKVASFGDFRHYYYKSKENIISHSDHVGYDFASTKEADIISSNAGVVTYADDNGIYGNMVMVDHGFGLHTLYAHCSSISVAKGDSIEAGSVVGKTGVSGLALGDHLHFGVLVHGIEVRPIEWYDTKWIQDNIILVFNAVESKLTSK